MGIEPLERRQLLAGTVFIVDEDAKTQGISGAYAAVDVTIGYAADKYRNYVLADNLNVNGQPFTDGRYFIKKPNLYVTLSEADDTVRVTGGRFDSVLIRTGGGNDRVEWNGRPSEDYSFAFNSVDIQLGAGDDRLITHDLTIADTLTIDGGSGRDRFEFASRTNVPTLLLKDLVGPSNVSLAGAAIDHLGLRTGNSIDRVSLTGGFIHDSLKLQTGGGNDGVSLTNYEAPPATQFLVDAGAGTNQVTDTRLAGTPTIGRVEAKLNDQELSLVGHGPLALKFRANYNPFESSDGTYVNADVPFYVNCRRQDTLLLDEVPTQTLIRIRLDDAVQAIDVDFDGFFYNEPKLDIATGGGNDQVNIGYTDLKILEINTGRGDDRVTLASYSDVTVQLGAGRDRLECTAAARLSVFDNSGPAIINIHDVSGPGSLYIEASNSIDRVTLKNVVATRLGLRLGGGADVLSETNVRVTKRDVDLGPQ